MMDLQILKYNFLASTAEVIDASFDGKAASSSAGPSVRYAAVVSAAARGSPGRVTHCECTWDLSEMNGMGINLQAPHRHDRAKVMVLMCFIVVRRRKRRKKNMGW
jgi:hypothetical protein